MSDPTRDQRLAVALAYEGAEHEHELCVWVLNWIDGKPPHPAIKHEAESLERLANLLAGACDAEQSPELAEIRPQGAPLIVRCKHIKPGDGGIVDGCGWQGPVGEAVTRCPNCGSTYLRPASPRNKQP